MIRQQILTGTWKTSLSCLCLLWGINISKAQEAANKVLQKAPKKTVAKDMLLLKNSDQLSGSLHSFHYPGVTVWQRSDINNPFEFNSDGIDEILLGDRPKPPSLPPEQVTIRLNNGDTITGDWKALDTETLTIETPFAGELQIPRNRWQWAAFRHSDAKYLFEGPTGEEGWTAGEVNVGDLDGGNWAYRNGAFYALKASSIAKLIGMPDRMRMEFDIEWKGSLNLAVALYTDYLQPVSLADKDSEPDFGGFYSLQLTSYAVNVLMVKKKEPLQYLGMTQTPVFRQATKAHVDVRTNKADNSISLLVNGKLVKRWIDQGGFAGEGSGIRLVHQGQGALRFSNLKIREWDGRFESPPTNRPQAKLDLLTNRTGDKLVGTVVSSLDERIQFKIGETITEIPFDQIEKIEIGGLPDAIRPVRDGEVNATLIGGGNLQFKMHTIEGNQITAESEVYGPVNMHLSMFERLDFQRVTPVKKP